MREIGDRRRVVHHAPVRHFHVLHFGKFTVGAHELERWNADGPALGAADSMDLHCVPKPEEVPGELALGPLVEGEHRLVRLEIILAVPPDDLGGDRRVHVLGDDLRQFPIVLLRHGYSPLSRTMHTPYCATVDPVPWMSPCFRPRLIISRRALQVDMTLDPPTKWPPKVRPPEGFTRTLPPGVMIPSSTNASVLPISTNPNSPMVIW